MPSEFEMLAAEPANFIAPKNVCQPRLAKALAGTLLKTVMPRPPRTTMIKAVIPAAFDEAPMHRAERRRQPMHLTADRTEMLAKAMPANRQIAGQAEQRFYELMSRVSPPPAPWMLTQRDHGR